MSAHPPSLRKAAILIASLDERTAERLLAQMGRQQADTVREAVETLGEIDPGEQRDVLEEFRRVNPLVPVPDHPGLELDASLAAKLGSPTYAEPWRQPVSPALSEPMPFRFLHEAESAMLTRYLEREHPQTIAIVVSHLPPAQAAEVLGRFPSALQANVLRRLVDLEETDPEVIREVELGLEGWVRDHVSAQKRRDAGVHAVKNILQAAGKSQQAILANLAKHDQQLAGKLSGAQASALLTARDDHPEPGHDEPWTFDDVVKLDDPALAIVFHEAGFDLALLTLAGADPTLMERLCKRSSAREAKQLRKALTQLGPTRLRDVEQAQQEMANIAQGLSRKGRIRAMFVAAV